MAKVTYFVVQPYCRFADGTLIRREPFEIPNAASACRHVERIVADGDAALAFSRSGDPDTGEFEDAIVLASGGLEMTEAAAA